MTLQEFLVKAKIHTYASAGEGGERNLDDGSKELIYEEGEWKYRDRYFGSDRFIGEEIVWQNGVVAWAMNYYGGVTADEVSAEKVYEFLKKALRQVEKDRPFRGPLELKEGAWEYHNENEGTIDDFKGREKILYREELVFELIYHGGAIQK